MQATYIDSDLQTYLQPTRYIDSDSPAVIDFARSAVTDNQTDLEKGIALYYAVRDGIRYSPYCITLDPGTYTGAHVLERKVGYCVQKAILLAAVARVAGIPSRVGFADVRNHLATQRLIELMRTDVFIYHGYTEMYLNGRWVKATPAFNSSLCERFGVKPLEFDGEHDSIFHPFDQAGNKHMEYLRDRGAFADFPFQDMVDAFREGYPHIFDEGGSGWPTGNFEQEAATSA
jgi:transglutaminase-like putative cysteine protease